MSETPRTGDRVRVSFETTVASGAPNPYLVWVDIEDGVETGPGRIVCVPTYAVEVLERADDPSKSLHGEVRECEPGLPAVCYGKDFWVFFRADGGAGYSVYRDEQMVGKPVIGVVPGTPAAANDPAEFMRKLTKVFRRAGESDADYRTRMVREGEAHEADGGVVHLGTVGDCEKCTPRRAVRVPNEPHGVPLGIRQQAAELLTSGNKRGAVGVLAAAMGISELESSTYVEDMPEYQTYLNHHGRTEVAPEEADRMRAMGFDRQPEFKVSDEDRASIQAVLDERTTEYVYGQDDGSWKLDGAALTGVVADIVWAAIRRDRERGDR